MRGRSIDASIRARAATNGGRRARECDAASRSGFQSPRALDRRRRARAMGAYERASAREGTTMTGAPKLEFVREMFDRVAETYDVVNGWLAFGFVDAWRARALESGYRAVLNALPNGRRVLTRGARVLDVGCGTGNVTEAVMYSTLAHLAVDVAGVDCSPGMIREARRKMPNNSFEVMDAAKLNEAFEEGSFDAAVTCYTLRNFPDFETALENMVRVVKPGGTIAIVDAFPPRGAFGWLLRAWLRVMLPLIGATLNGERKAYEYLGRSIEAARTPEEVVAELEMLGCEAVEASRMFPFGAAAVVVGRKPE